MADGMVSRANKDVSDPARTDDVAIVGAGCRLPGGISDLDGFWRLLRDGVDAVGEVPEGRWDIGAYHSAERARPGRIYTRAGGFLPSVDGFDPDFFGISPREAGQMDPQQRLLLELAVEAIEDAGMPLSRLAGSATGVFVGISSSDYGSLQWSDPTAANAYTNAGAALSIAANRISYVFDLHGPSLSVDTACSSSLVALHLGCESLHRGESSLAMVAGVNLVLAPFPSIGFAKASMLSPTGRCRSFDAAADGYVRSEGGVVLLLRLLEAARAAGDRILAVIRGTGVNADGVKTGLSLPNGAAQTALLRQVYQRSGVHPDQLAYFEAHGTGTPVGDPTECGAVGAALGQLRRPGNPLPIGSVKSNIGHLEPASGLAGVLKAILALRHREIPANLHFARGNPNIPFAELNLRVAGAPIAITEPPERSLIGVNSFGFGGANAHAILAPAPEADPATNAVIEQTGPLLLSAASDAALAARAAQFAAFLDTAPASAWGDIVGTAAHQREHRAHRLVAAAPSAREAAAALRRFATDPVATPSVIAGQVLRSVAAAPAPVLVFSGNGGQWAGMGRALARADATFRGAVEDVAARLAKLGGPDLRGPLLGDADTPHVYRRTDIAQPALFALQVGLIACLRRDGVTPSAVVGHSVGEVAAAFAAGALDLGQAVRVIHERSRAQHRTAGRGGMAAVGLAPEAAAEAIQFAAPDLEIAGVNSPNAVTVAGPAEALDALHAALAPRGTFFRRLDLDYAFHSAAMDAIEDDLRAALDGLAPSPTDIPFASGVTGGPLAGDALGADYWWANIRKPVQFAPALRHLIAQGARTFLEVGPHPILRHYVTETLREAGVEGLVLPTLRRGEDEADDLRAVAPNLFVAGAPVDLSRWVPMPGRHAALPAYPWQRTRHWHDAKAGTPLGGGLAEVAGPRAHPLLGSRMQGGEPAWMSELDLETLPWLADHVVQGAPVLPAAAYVEMAVAAAELGLPGAGVEIENLDIRQAMVLSPGETRRVHTQLDPGDGTIHLRSRAAPSEDWTLHAITRALRPGGPDLGWLDVPALRARLHRGPDAAAFYADASGRGLDYGPAFRGVAELWLGEDEALARIERPDGLDDASLAGHRLHPALFDSCLQTMLALLREPDEAAERAAWLPIHVARLRLAPGPWRIAHCHMRLQRRGAYSALASFRLIGPDGAVLAECSGARAKRVAFVRRGAGVRSFATELRPAPRVPAELDAALAVESGLGARVAARMATAARDLVREDFYLTVRPRLDALCAAYALDAIRTLADRNERFDLAALLGRFDPDSTAGRQLEALLGMVVDDQLIEPTEQHGVWTIPADAPDPAALWRGILADHPEIVAELMLIGRCGDHLPAILNGTIQPLELIFGESSAVAEHFYDFAPFGRIYGQALREAVQAVLDAAPPGRVVRILEIGGGTGGATASLASLLSPDRVRYTFTDASSSLLDRAAPRFEASSAMEYRLLDIEEDPAAQGFAAAEFDIVIAANVLHATQDLGVTLDHVGALLRPGGLLLAIETQRQRFLDLIFGTLPGWWRFADHEWRTDHSLLTPARWRDRLAAAGFVAVTAVDDAPPGVVPTNIVLLANKRRQAVAALGEAALPPPPSGRDFVLLATPGDRVAAAALDALHAGGEAAVTLTPPGTDDVRAEDYLALFRRAGLAGSPPPHFVDFGPGDGDPVPTARLLALAPLLQAAEALWGSLDGTSLTLVTREGIAGTPAEAAVRAVGRVVANEYPSLAVRLLDVDDASASDGALLAAELAAPDSPEADVVLRGGLRCLPRLRPLGASIAPGSARMALQVGRLGALDSLHACEAEPRAPAPDEVEAEVRAVGLNFHDLMWANGMLPEEAVETGFVGATLGMEFAGVITRVGDAVEGLAVGDRVMGMARASLASHVTTPAGLVGRMPEHLSFEAGATMPGAMLTVVHALEHVGRMQPGETLLLHAATGGVGLAAIQFARVLGIEVIATAGSAEKRALLRRLGVRHVLDSRSPEFHAGVLAATGGAGVDAVLNSIAGEAIPRSMDLLKPFGRFLELGKRDFYANSRLGLRPFRENVAFFGIDVDQMMVQRPALTFAHYRRVLDLLRSGAIGPLPYRAFPIARAVEAFRLMQKARHVGKIVLTMAGERTPIVSQPRALRLDPAKSYLVTGGTGGFGLATAEWLAARGARHLVLVSRRGVTEDTARRAIDRLRAAGVDVTVAQADVADEAAIGAVFAGLAASGHRLGGVVHAAMALSDAAMANLTPEAWRTALRPKALGALNLHRLCTGLTDLDFFVLYSSATTVFGNPGQANYVAGNALLEALARMRRARGLPALAVAWGAIGEVGFLARHDTLSRGMEENFGLRLMPPDAALAALERAMVEDRAEVLIADLDWSRLLGAVRTGRWSGFADLAAPAARSASDAPAASLAELRAVIAALPRVDAEAKVRSAILAEIATVLRLPADRIALDRPLTRMGVDSLMLVELQTAFESRLGLNLPSMRMAGLTIAALVTLATDALGGAPPDAADRTQRDAAEALAEAAE